MQKSPMKKEFESYSKKNQRRRLWQRVVSMLTCIIVFCTTYALILPAITLTGEATCGLEEHTHKDDCYAQVQVTTLICEPVHVHSAECYDAEQTLICGQADFVLHTHDEFCFDADGKLICGLEKLEEHTHTDECYTLVEQTPAGHVHEDTCYTTEQGELICQREETEGHSHTESCYGEPVLTCGQEETEGHTHSDACRTVTVTCTLEENEEHTHTEECTTATLTCGLEETEGHTHTEACTTAPLTCTLEETEGHQHGSECYEIIETLTCDLEEIQETTEAEAEPEYILTCTKPEVTAHTHTESCYETRKDEDGEEYTVLICTELEVLQHQHTAECTETTTTQGELICEEEEHVHEDSCFPEIIEQSNSTLLFSNGVDESDSSDTSTASSSLNIFDIGKKDTDKDGDIDENDKNPVTIKYSDTKYDPNSETYDLNLEVDWGLTYTELLNYDAFHVALPDGLIIPDSLLNQVRYATDDQKGGMVAFDYWFEKNADGEYVIHIDYRDDYVARMNTEKSDGSYSISFGGTIDKTAINDDGDIDLNWSDNAYTTIGADVIEYPDNETLNYDLHTQKQGTFDITTNTLTYTVKVYSDKGTPAGQTISVTDTMTLNGITIASVTGNPSVSITDSAGNVVSGATTNPTTVDGKPTIEVTNLPALGEGGYYLITYTYKIDALDPGVERSPYNSVTAQVPDNPDSNEPLTSTSSTSVKVSKQMISKTGSYSAESGIITWTITVNSAGDDISGYVLTDDMLQNALSLNITPADSNYTINKDSNDKISSIKFNSGSDGKNTNTYTITYTTAQDQSTAGGYTSNDATLTPPNENEKPSTSGDINVWVPASGGISKQFASMEGSVLNWSVSVAIPDGGIGKGTVIKDNTGYNWDSKADNHWMTPAQIYALNEELSGKLSGIDYTLEFSADGYNWDTYEEAIADTNTTKYYCWRVTFNEDVPKTELGSLTIDYSTTGDTSKANTFVNTAKMGDYSSTANKDYKPNVAKIDRYGNSGTSNVTANDGVIGWYVRVIPNENIYLCYDENGKLICESSDANHVHSCYNTENEVCCGLTEHTHGSDCYDGDTLTCTETEHTHISATISLSDYIPGHGYNACYDGDNNLICTKHVHADSCYTNDELTCTQTGHTHGCYNSDAELVCNLHVHGDDCYDDSGELTCDKPEHTHLSFGLTLTKVGIGTGMNLNSSAVSASGIVTGWDNLMGTYTYNSDTQAVNMVISPADPSYRNYLPANSEIYVYFECTIDNMPDPGKSETYTFTNHATVDSIPVEQTQNVTVTVPATVVKMDRNGSSGDTTHNYDSADPSLGWLVRVYLPEGIDPTTTPLVVEDQLPAGLKLTKIGIGNSAYNAQYGKDWSKNPATETCVSVGDATSGSIYGTNNSNQPIYQSTYSISAQTVTVNITNGGNEIAENSYIYIYFECEMTEDAQGTTTEDTVTTTTYTFKNSATVTVGDLSHGSDDQTQTIIKSDVTEEERPVDKSVNFDEGVSQLQYTVLLNEKGTDLDPNKDTIKVVDVMTHNVDRWWNTKHSTLISSSVKLYEPLKDAAGNILYDENGAALPNLDKEIPADQWSWIFYDNYEDVLNYKSDQIVNTIEAWIPDGTPVVLKYIYAFDIDAEWNVGFQVSNKVTIYGETATTDEVTSNETWQYSEVTATATSSGTYTVHKVEKDNYNIVLPGAEFTVYTYSNDQPVLDANNNVVVYTTDSDGLVKITRESYFQEDVVYYVMETKAPDGYFLPNEPTKVYFYFGGDNVSSLQIPSGAVDLAQTFGVAYIQNEVDSMKITVNKTWVDANGEPTSAPDDVTEIQFQLIQTDISGNEVTWYVAPTDATDAQKEGQYYVISLVNGEWQAVTIEDLQAEDLDGNPYTYTVKELNVPSDYVSETSTDANGNITITNRQKETTSITVQKAWHDADMTKNPVQVQLYRTIDTLYTDYTAYLCYIDGTAGVRLGADTPFTVTQSITGAGTYTFKWDMNLFGFKDTANADAFYIDVVDPNFALDGYTVTNLSITTDKGTYGVNGNFEYFFSEHGGGFKRINFYNIYDDALYMDNRPEISSTGYLEVSFTLVAPTDDENNGVLPALNEFVSAANTGGVAIGEPVTLDSSGWSHTWSDLPLTGVDSDGNLVYYSYYVKEITDGYEVRYSNQYAVDEGTITVTNYPKSTAELTVDKQWLDEAGNTIPPAEDSVTYDLYQEKLYTLKIYKGGWGWANEDIVYVKPGTTITLTFIGNSLVESQNYTLVSKELIGYFGAHNDYVELYKYTYTRTITADITSIGMSYAGYTTDNWQTTSFGYDVGTYDFYDTNKQSNGTITLGSYELLTPAPDGYTPQYERVGEFTLSESNNWSNTHEELAPGRYKVVETTTGYQTTYIVGADGEEQTNAPELELEAGEEGSVTINNRLSTTEITVDKSWLDNGERYDVDMITFTLYQNGVEYSTGTLYMEKDEETGEYSWTTTIKDLPKYYTDEDGKQQLCVYTIKENPIDGYKTSYSNGTTSSDNYSEVGVTGGGTITIVNERVTSIGVKKYWADGVSPTAVRMELWRYTSTEEATEFVVPTTSDGQVDYEALQNAENTSFVRYTTICDSSGAENSTSASSKTFKNLELYDFNTDGSVKEYYTYFIVEVASGYVKTYTEDNFITGGSYSITNDIETTSISVAKVWHNDPTNQTPVDVSLYQVFTVSKDHDCNFTYVVTAPTCTEQGYTTKTCECGVVEVGNYVAATGHSWNHGVVTVQPTETTTGLKVYTCTVCGASREETLDPQHTHNYSTASLTTAATCTQAGETTYTCSCGEFITKAEPAATGHTFPEEWTVTTAASCTTAGEQTKTCTVCNGAEANGVLTQSIDALGHSYCTCSTQEESDACDYCVYTAPTTDKAGSIVRTCKRDGCSVQDTTVLEATGGTTTDGVTVLYDCGTGAGITCSSNSDNFEVYSNADDTSIFSSGGYFSVYYTKSYDGYGLYIKKNGSKDYMYSNPETLSSGYLSTIAIPAADMSDVTSLMVGGWGITVTKVTWTPGTSPSSLSLTGYSMRTLLSSGTDSSDTSSSSNSLSGTFISTKQVVPGTATTWTDLPQYKLDSNGNILGEYTYYVVEVGGEEYDATYSYGTVENAPQMSSGIASGTITITNHQQYSYELPSTGSVGTQQYTLGGVVLCMAAVLMYIHKKGRKGARTP